MIIQNLFLLQLNEIKNMVGWAIDRIEERKPYELSCMNSAVWTQQYTLLYELSCMNSTVWTRLLQLY